MAKPSPRAVSLAPGLNEPALSPAQKTFQSLIRQIDKRRQRLRDWEATLPVFQQRYVSELLPRNGEVSVLVARLVRRLDEASGRKGVTKTELRTITELIVELASDVLADGEDEEIRAILERHDPPIDDAEAAAGAADLKAMFESMLGVKLGDDIDLSSPDEVMRRAHAHMEGQWEREQAAFHAAREAQDAQQAQRAWEAQQAQEAARRAGRRPNARQAAAQARKDAEQAALSQSIRDVYRKLASALHPDREPDPAERARKTALMQRANQAYQKNNLLELLELQLELEQIDQDHIDGLSEARLKHYNKILREQVRELDQEILHVELGFRDTYGISPLASVSPDKALGMMEHDLEELQRDLDTLAADLLVFDDPDPKALKRWLKMQKYRAPRGGFGGMPF